MTPNPLRDLSERAHWSTADAWPKEKVILVLIVICAILVLGALGA